tara:strand:+ start:2907 stop:4841 length:1935 start_codon:yes stop_codon:yes gene_type:complete
MPLINLKTNLKSLKFGNDRPGGGSSNQPYIKSKIPSQDSNSSSISSTGGTDSLLRGGILAPIRAAEDTSRLIKMFDDDKSTTGLLFTVKQNLLSRLSVHTEASFGIGYGGGKLNQGIYTPASTIGQAIAGFTGTHLNAFGLNPLQPLGTGELNNPRRQSFLTGLRRYENIVRYNNLKAENKEQSERASGRDLAGNVGGIPGLISGAIAGGVNLLLGGGDEITNKSTVGNRLENYLNNYINKPTKATHFPPTTGGPGSTLGLGTTRISLASLNQRTGKNNIRALNESDYFYKGKYDKFPSNPINDFNEPTGSINYEELLGEKYNKFDNNITKIEKSLTWDNIKAQRNNIYKKENNKQTLNTNQENATTWTQQQIREVDNDDLSIEKGKIKDFREEIPTTSDQFTKKKILGKLTKGSYESAKMSTRIKSGDPGISKNVTKYGSAYTSPKPLDEITALPVTELQDKPNHIEYPDLCDFSIGVIRGSTRAKYMHFRAFIDSFDDSYTADWGSTQYVGRGDKFYNYKGFDRTINMSFTVAAQSKAELFPMYEKLNYLASSLAPSYGGGFMRGNLVRLTVGGYLKNQVGILKGITYTIPSESPWEIGLDDDESIDDSLKHKQLPHIIKVSGFTFTPIQNFIPQVGERFIG